MLLVIPLFSIDHPDRFDKHYSKLMTILNLETYNIGGDISKIIDLPESEPSEELKPKLELLGLESTNFIENEGNFIFIMIILKPNILGMLSLRSVTLSTLF